jgi:prephenate dehydratase
MDKTIAIQGDKASFHDIAAAQYFEGSRDRVFCDTFSRTFEAIATGEADYALCAIENSLYGSINEVYDLLLTNKVRIIGEVYLRIEQCLIGLPGAELDGLVEVHSHPVALAQCERYLDDVLPSVTRMEYHDTAASVSMVAQLQDPSIGAIASRDAAELYGMQIMAPSIETDTQNYTRFVVLSADSDVPDITDKTSLVVRTDGSPGALYRALGCFAKRSIDLTKLQSRPVVGRAWDYMFYIDVSIGGQDLIFNTIISELEGQSCQVTILGSYKAGLKV